MIRSITERTGCKIEIHDDGRVDIASTDEAAAQKAVADHQGADRRGRAGQDLRGQGRARGQLRRVRRDPPRRRGPAAHLRDRRPPHREVRDVLDEGDETLVKVIDIDAQGRVRLSRRAAMREQEGGDAARWRRRPAPADREERPRRPRDDRGPPRGPRWRRSRTARWRLGLGRGPTVERLTVRTTGRKKGRVRGPALFLLSLCRSPSAYWSTTSTRSPTAISRTDRWTFAGGGHRLDGQDHGLAQLHPRQVLAVAVQRQHVAGLHAAGQAQIGVDDVSLGDVHQRSSGRATINPLGPSDGVTS